jgi:hypothetical protein
LILDVRDGDTPPPVFWKKSLQSIENKGREFGKERQESSRGGKILQGKEIEEAEQVSELGRGCCWGEVPVKGWPGRVFTSDDRTDYLSCQYIKWVLVFRDWAQEPKGDFIRKSRNAVRSSGYRTVDCS